jgi:predicted RecB family nuclease
LGREKYHHALKALAIRDRKIHVVGAPELALIGTSVYLDVEGLADRGFYYLIGLRIPDGPSPLQYSLWADDPSDEQRIWQSFLDILRAIDNPVLIHYGAYETNFLKRLASRYSGLTADTAYVDGLIKRAVKSLGDHLCADLFANLFKRTQGSCPVPRFPAIASFVVRSPVYCLETAIGGNNRPSN